jgi:hypothetical protein
MQIEDLFNANTHKKELGYDLKDDLICFMQNDPDFYRKQYFPVMHRFKEYVESGKLVKSRAFESLVKNAYEQYNNKFKVEGLEPDLEKDMCAEICADLHRIESDNIDNGHYDEK